MSLRAITVKLSRRNRFTKTKLAISCDIFHFLTLSPIQILIPVASSTTPPNLTSLFKSHLRIEMMGYYIDIQYTKNRCFCHMRRLDTDAVHGHESETSRGDLTYHTHPPSQLAFRIQQNWYKHRYMAIVHVTKA